MLQGPPGDAPRSLGDPPGTPPGTPGSGFFEFCSDFGGVLGGGVEMSTFLDGFGVDFSAVVGLIIVIYLFVIITSKVLIFINNL